ncbi:MAG: type III-B CRISPR module-associated Cmr3 family protein, partial [Rhizonema sp. PD38]|nr:type III-B CRISPR module-associated Cmr3 family protein [Rhizonema sp. PD38]
ADGYFTEVAVRLQDEWCFVAAFSEEISESVVRLGGEGHRAIISRLKLETNTTLFEQLNFLSKGDRSSTIPEFAYLLTPGLALYEEARYSSYPSAWKQQLKGCATDKALLWGGVSTMRKDLDDKTTKEEFALLPQRAFVPPGTVYVFNGEVLTNSRLLPEQDERRWLETFKQLNYGKLLWGQGT